MLLYIRPQIYKKNYYIFWFYYIFFSFNCIIIINSNTISNEFKQCCLKNNIGIKKIHKGIFMRKILNKNYLKFLENKFSILFSNNIENLFSLIKKHKIIVLNYILSKYILNHKYLRSINSIYNFFKKNYIYIYSYIYKILFNNIIYIITHIKKIIVILNKSLIKTFPND